MNLQSELKEQSSKKIKILKIIVLFMILAPWNLFLGPLFLFLSTAALSGMIAKRRWSAVLILFIAALGIVWGISLKVYASILSSIFLFLLGLIFYRQLGDISGSQIKIKTTTGFKRIYSFLLDALLAFLIGVIFFLLGYAFIARPFQVGTGMEPTIKSGSYVLQLLLPLRFINPGRKDIVFFTIPKNPEKDYIARIIGVPGDKLLLKDGFIYLNGKLLDEPYTLKPRSTWAFDDAAFGNNCKEMIVPDNSYFLLGDNREISGFSIYLGFISKDKIIGYIPHNLVRFLTYYPIDWSSHLRDTSRDKNLMGKSALDTNRFIHLLNTKREEEGLKPLILDKKLSEAAKLRAKTIIKYNDTSLDATKSGYTMFKAWKDVGYSKNYGGENNVFGNFDAESLLNGWWDPELGKSILNDKNVSDVGISSFTTSVNNCPNQINVVEFGGLVK